MVKMIYFQVIFGLVALSIPYIVPRIKVLMTLTGANRRDWTPKNIATCQSMHPDRLHGCEDMHLHIDGKDRILFLACAASLEDRVDWFPAMGHSSKPKSIKDKLFAWNLSSDQVTELTTSWTGDFVSHGIDVVPTRKPREVAIYVINHLTRGSVVEKFTHTVGSQTVSHIKTFDDQTVVTTPNDIYVSDESDDRFYVTNDHRFKTGAMRELESILQLPTTSLALHSNSQSGYRIVQNNLININGLAGDRAGRFFMNHVSAAFSVYNYDHTGNVTLAQHFRTGHCVDNPSFSEETNEIILSGFPNAVELAEFAKRPHELAAGSILTRINLDHLAKTATGTSTAIPPLDEFFLDPGTGVMNMSTTAVVDKQGDSWYMTGAFSHAVVKCTGYSQTY